MKKKVFILIGVLCIACNKDREIKQLLNGPKPMDRIEGCYEAMETDDLVYVPLVLKNSGIGAVTSDFRHKGTSVYQASMYSLIKLLKVKPPHPITMVTDSVNVRFYLNYWEGYKKRHPIKK